MSARGFASQATVSIDFSKAYQTIDGFGMNINSKYWDTLSR